MKILEVVVKCVVYDKDSGRVEGECEYGKKLEVCNKAWQERREDPKLMTESITSLLSTPPKKPIGMKIRCGVEEADLCS